MVVEQLGITRHGLVRPVLQIGHACDGLWPLHRWLPTTIEANGQPLDVTVHFARVGGRMTCVGLDIRSFRSFGSNPPEGMSRLLPVGMNLTEITSPLLRAVPTATVIEKASADFRSGILGALDRQVGDLNGMGVLGALAGAGRPQVNAILDGPSARRRGPKPQWMTLRSATWLRGRTWMPRASEFRPFKRRFGPQS